MSEVIYTPSEHIILRQSSSFLPTLRHKCWEVARLILQHFCCREGLDPSHIMPALMNLTYQLEYPIGPAEE